MEIGRRVKGRIRAIKYVSNLILIGRRKWGKGGKVGLKDDDRYLEDEPAN